MQSEQMQSLLSKAVEDQAAEQRNVSATLAQIRDRVSALSEEVAALSGLGDAVGTVDADLRRSTTLLADRLNALAAEVTGGAGRDVAGLREDLARITGRPAAPSADEIASRVAADLAAGVVSPVVEQVPAVVVDPVVAGVVDAVDRIVAASEARVLAYVDSAVLALAQALLVGIPADAPGVEAPADEEDAVTELRPADARRGRWRQT